MLTRNRKKTVFYLLLYLSSAMIRWAVGLEENASKTKLKTATM